MLVIILPTSTSHSKVAPSPCSLKVSLFGRTFLITLYNVAKLPLGFVEAVADGEGMLSESRENGSAWELG